MTYQPCLSFGNTRQLGRVGEECSGWQRSSLAEHLAIQVVHGNVALSFPLTFHIFFFFGSLPTLQGCVSLFLLLSESQGSFRNQSSLCPIIRTSERAIQKFQYGIASDVLTVTQQEPSFSNP